MSELAAAIGAAQVTTVAKEVFAAMVDGQAGFLTSGPGISVSLADPLHAWVDMDTEPPSRVQATTDANTADDLTRAFLHMDAAEDVAEADVADAFVEIVNIMGGNMKALLPKHVQLTLPKVSRQSPLGPTRCGCSRCRSRGVGTHSSSPCGPSEDPTCGRSDDSSGPTHRRPGHPVPEMTESIGTPDMAS